MRYDWSFMARPKKYDDRAAKQRAYRQRKYWETLTPEESAFSRAQFAHENFVGYANRGDEVAAQLVGKNCYETGLNVLAHLGCDALRLSHQKKIVPVNDPFWFRVKSE
jgi:hypothetical protein